MSGLCGAETSGCVPINVVIECTVFKNERPKDNGYWLD